MGSLIDKLREDEEIIRKVKLREMKFYKLLK